MEVLAAAGAGEVAETAGVLPVVVVGLGDLQGLWVFPLPIVRVPVDEGKIRPIPVAGGDLVPPSLLAVPDGPACGAKPAKEKLDQLMSQEAA